MMAEERQPRRLKEALPYLLIAPVLLYYLAFWMRPVLAALYQSVADADGSFTLRYYQMLFEDPYFVRGAVNTGIIVLISVSLEFVLAYGLALLINTRFRGSTFFLFLALIPMALPPVAVGAMWASGLATYGWLNSLLVHLGLLGVDERIAFLAGGEARSLAVIILVDGWQVVPFMMILLLAGLQNLPRETVEAGRVFGGSQWTVIWRIVTPQLRATIQTALLLRIIAAIQIWLIIVMLFGFRRVPVLLEEVMYYQEELGGPLYQRIAMAYAVIVAVIVSTVAVLYLKVSGGGRQEVNE